MIDNEPPDNRSESLLGRAGKRIKRLAGPTLGMFGLDSDGHLLPAALEPGETSAAQVREAGEKDDHARLAIAEAEIATERSEKRQQAAPGSASSKG